MTRPKFNRILLKLSGEALMGDQSFGISPEMIKYVAEEARSVFDLGVQLAIVVGGGNIFRGVSAASYGMDRVSADRMGMLATVINSLALQDALEGRGIQTRVQTAISMHEVAEPFISRRAIRHLEKGRVVIFAAGTGNPYFTTDTAAVLRAQEIQAEILLKATKVDGLYDSDPAINKNAKFIEKIRYMEVLEKQLHVMDMTAISLAMDNDLPLVVFNLMSKGNIRKVVCGDVVGTQDTRESMEKSIVALKNELNRVRTGRASLSIFDDIRVDYYGTLTPLNQMASLSVPESRLITIQPWDVSIIKEIEKAILKSDLGLTPSNDGKLMRISIPALTEDRRKQLVKVVQKKGEEHKIAVRNIRRDSNDLLKGLKKDGDISEDDAFRAQDQVQKITDEHTKRMDEICKEKEQEILEF